MTAGRTAVGARKAALAKGRRKRVVFIVGGLRVCGQRCAGAGRPIAADEPAGAGLTHWGSVCGPGRCAVMELRVEVDGGGEPKALAELHVAAERPAPHVTLAQNIPSPPKNSFPTPQHCLTLLHHNFLGGSSYCILSIVTCIIVLKPSMICSHKLSRRCSAGLASPLQGDA
jgi:hypothetical protein